MALFVLILVGVVVAQTWFDWRDAKKTWVIPEWAKGMALGGLIAVSLAATTSVATVWLGDDAGQLSNGFSSRLFWPELLFRARRDGNPRGRSPQEMDALPASGRGRGDCGVLARNVALTAILSLRASLLS